MRLASSGLTFAGWFGAIAYLSAPVATALMLLDCIILAAIKSARINVRASTAEWALSLSLVAYVVAIWQVSLVTTGHIVIGSAAAGAAILARAASMHLWQVGTEIGEVAFHRIAIPLAGGFLAGLFGSGGIPSFVGVDFGHSSFGSDRLYDYRFPGWPIGPFSGPLDRRAGSAGAGGICGATAV
jgi:hypothetical protein